jgi:hypothetical protein
MALGRHLRTTWHNSTFIDEARALALTTRVETIIY